MHRDVVNLVALSALFPGTACVRCTYVDILNNVDLADVLSQGAYTDAMATIAVHVLNQNFGAVGLERNAVVSIIDYTVLDHDVRAAICVPAIRVLRLVLTGAVAADVEVVEDYVGTVGQEIVPLRRVSQVEVRDESTL